MDDWINHVIQFQPDARLLEEHLRLHDWKEAYDQSTKMIHDLVKLQMWMKQNGKV
jgi:hypothetical protein